MKLTVKEEEIMTIFWEHGEMFIRDILNYLPEPKPSYNTVGTQVKFLEEKGFVSAYEREATAGKPRRYYHLTQEGHRALHEKEEAWNVYARAVGQVLKGGACCAGA